ncbi:hypothetical protein NKI38_32150 [Mesorhizobium sp. M0621]|uniref:hypothetical protein n=1 Tax=Mesorhizobium sp. M0621 TaxID=2956974 RepID=UPI003336F727
MFDGYAGSSASGFRQEVEQEHHLGQLDDIVAHYETAQRGERLAGPGASRVIHEIDRVAQEIGSLPGVIADGKRVKAMLAHLARTLHVGYLNDCFFEPATALRVRQASPSCRTAPLTAARTPASRVVTCRRGRLRSRMPGPCWKRSDCRACSGAQSGRTGIE